MNTKNYCLQKAQQFFLFVLFFSFSCSYSQNNTTYSSEKKESFVFSQIDYPTKKSEITNSLIKNIAEKLHTSSSVIQYTYRFTYYHSTTLPLKQIKFLFKQFQTSTLFSDGQCSNNILYRGISLDNILLPHNVDFILSIKNKKGNIIKSIEIKNLPLNKGIGKTSIIPFYYPCLSPSFSYSLNNIKFYYNDTIINAFKKKIELIDDYHAAIASMSTYLDRLSAINIDNVELIKLYEIDIKESEIFIEQLKKKSFYSAIPLPVSDSVKFSITYNLLDSTIQQQRITINKLLKKLDTLYFTKGLEKLKKGNIEEALRLFKKSLAENQYYCPALLNTAIIYYKQGNINEASSSLTKITAQHAPDQEIVDQVIPLAKEIHTSYQLKTAEMIRSEQYHEALKYAEQAKTFCTTIKLIPCSDSIQTFIAYAKYGIYKSFIIVSQKAIDKKIFDLAETYTIKAKDYQHENAIEITSAIEANILLYQLIESYTAKGSFFNKHQQYDSALVYFTKAVSFCKQFPEINCPKPLTQSITYAKNGLYKSLLQKAASFIYYKDPENAENAVIKARKYQQENSTEIPTATSTDSLMQRIQKIRYDKYIADGTLSLIWGNGIKALSNFDLAKKIEKEHPTFKNHTLDSLIILSIKPYILNIIEKGSMHSWGNELEKAHNMKDSAINLQLNYDLTADTTINRYLTELDININKQHCRNSQEAYNESYRNAFQQIAKKNFNIAYDFLNQCIQLAEKNKDCTIKDSLAKSAKKKYEEIATYQKLVKKSDSLVIAAKYNDAILSYIECDNYYNTHDFQSFDITHLPTINYLSTRKDNRLVYESAIYYFSITDYSSSFYLLEILRKRGYAESFTKELQESLASTLAKEDFLKNSQGKPIENITHYTSGNAWYATFKSTYMTKWKELKKRP